MPHYISEATQHGHAFKHGMTKTPTYRVWSSIIDRCTNPNYREHHLYIDRGITICPEWRYDFAAFYAYVSQLPHFGEKGYSLDRVDNSLGYQPDNLRYATPKEQTRNTRWNTMITWQGETLCVTDWAEKIGISYWTLRYRISVAKWPIEKAFTTPVKT